MSDLNFSGFTLPITYEKNHTFRQLTKESWLDSSGSIFRKVSSHNHKLNDKCWVCDGHTHAIFSDHFVSKISSTNFKITDSEYGVTLQLTQCQGCGFIQAMDPSNLISLYESMEDHEYEATRPFRSIQARKLLNRLNRHTTEHKLLDLGAGSGILVEEALKLNFHAVGVEPSHWLVNRAKERNLPVLQGTLPQKVLKRDFDIITIVDVIEHVSDPSSIIEEAEKLLLQDGKILVVTPNINSLAARLLGKRWWHYRVAHVGYFNLATLDLLLKKHGFSRVSHFSPTWYFPFSYLAERLLSLLNKSNCKFSGGFCKNLLIPLNLFDSIAVVYKREK